MFRKIIHIMLLIVAAVAVTPLHAQDSEKPASADELREIAVDAYVYAYPMIIMELTRRVSTNVADTQHPGKAPVNTFAHMPAFPDASFKDVVRPNADTLYSMIWFDVSHEPLLLSVPDSAGRYYLLPMMDMWSDVFASPGTRTTGNKAQLIALVGANWQGTLPPDAREIRAPTSTGWMIGRTQTNGKADYAAVHQFQAGLKATPLSQWGKTAEPTPAKVNPDWQVKMPPVVQAEKLSANDYFTLFSQLMISNAPHANDYPILQRMEQLGIKPGVAFDFAKASPEVQQALNAAIPAANKMIRDRFMTSGTAKAGWRTNLTGIGTYGTDYLSRAGVAFAGLGANTIEDAVYPSALTDIDGHPFSSDKRYVLHFDKEKLPPVRGFWSLTVYNDKQLFAANSLNRYAIGNRDKLAYSADGSLDIYIQRASPGAEHEANWLPAPESGLFTMNLRLYWPMQSVLNGGWMVPSVQVVP